MKKTTHIGSDDSGLFDCQPTLEGAGTNTTLKLTYWHLSIWLVMAAVAAAITFQACQVYLTNKTPGKVAVTTVAVLAGPMVGPIANPYAGISRFTIVSMLIVSFGVILALCPFVFVKRRVSNWGFAAAWSGFLVASAIYFTAAVVSLGTYLS